MILLEIQIAVLIFIQRSLDKLLFLWLASGQTVMCRFKWASNQLVVCVNTLYSKIFQNGRMLPEGNHSFLPLSFCWGINFRKNTARGNA